jgi:hypothetical protein
MALEGDRAVLAVYVVWHPSYKLGSNQADTLFKWLCGDPSTPAVRGLGIPVRFRTSGPEGSEPSSISFESAEHTAVIVLIDDEMVASNWDSYLKGLFAAARPQRDMVMPVAISESAMQFDQEITGHNFARLDKICLEERDSVLVNRVMRNLCQLLIEGDAKTQVFLSHAKHDGLGIAREVQRHLHEQVGLSDFFDTTDIPDGSQFADVLTDALAKSAVLLVIHTDSYGSREWCRLEVLTGKRHRLPIVVLSAVDIGEVRSFPYLGNIPVVRWKGADASMERLVGVLLREVLRARYFPLRVAAIRRMRGIETTGNAFVYPPELLTALLLRTDRQSGPIGIYLYPDPPLGNEELALITTLDPTIEPLTLTMLVSR